MLSSTFKVGDFTTAKSDIINSTLSNRIKNALINQLDEMVNDPEIRKYNYIQFLHNGSVILELNHESTLNEELNILRLDVKFPNTMIIKASSLLHHLTNRNILNSMTLVNASIHNILDYMQTNENALNQPIYSAFMIGFKISSTMFWCKCVEFFSPTYLPMILNVVFLISNIRAFMNLDLKLN